MTGEIEAFSVTLPRAGLQVHGLQAGHAGVPLLLLHGTQAAQKGCCFRGCCTCTCCCLTDRLIKLNA